MKGNIQLAFEEILGNDKIKKNLEEAVSTGTISHSYLFIGQEGIGKKIFAKEFAKMILCTSENKLCNNCSSCIKFDGGNNPDFRLIEPDGNSIKIAQIRELLEKIYEKPIISNKKVVIIDNSDKMTEEAQNSLLKTLEEPPEYIVIILIASNESKIVNTIKSRCIKVGFTEIPKDKIKEYITKNKIIGNPSQSILTLCGGSIGKLKSIAQNIETYTQLEQTMQELMNSKIKNMVQMFNEFQVLYNSKELIGELLDYMMVIIYENIKTESFYKMNFLNIISKIENTKIKLNLNTNFDMSIDDLLMDIWDNVK